MLKKCFKNFLLPLYVFLVPVLGVAQDPNVKISAVFPSDPSIFTQGLEYHEGKLYQSSGLYQKSFIRVWDPETEQIFNQIEIEPSLFAEGITIINNQLYMVSWRENKCLVFDPETLEQLHTYYYNGEGWGLANNGSEIIMSNGTPEIVFRNPLDFSITRQITVTQNGNPIRNINELEYHDGYIYANIFMQNAIIIIDEDTGEIVKAVNFPVKQLMGETSQEQVLNGIARNPDTGNFLITGKLYPSFFEVDFTILELDEVDEKDTPASKTTSASQPTSQPTETQMEKSSPSGNANN